MPLKDTFLSVFLYANCRIQITAIVYIIDKDGWMSD